MMKQNNLTETMSFNSEEIRRETIHEVLKQVEASLSERGYNAINQLAGYLISDDPAYISSHNNSRSLIQSVERHEIIEELVRFYLEAKHEMTRQLGLDLSSVTCGVSFSDTGFIARTIETIRFKPDDYNMALDKVLDIVDREKPDVIVLGLPLLLNDDVGPRAQICLEFGEVLEQESGIPVKMQDERFTTAVAESILLEADVSRKKRKKKIDQLAAVQILQTWLDRNVK